MTNQEFNYHYRVATGINWLNAEWIEAHKPNTYEEKIKYFAKLIGYVALLKNMHYGQNNVVKKYGRFNINGSASVLSEALLEIIFGKQSTTEDFDNSENVTENLALIFENLSDIPEDKKDNTFIYLITTNTDRVYETYSYNNEFVSKGLYTVINTENNFTNISQATAELTSEDLQIDTELLNLSELSILYQIASNTYLLYEYNRFSSSWLKKEKIYNDGSDSIDIGIQYLLDDNNEYILTHDGQKIIIN